MSKFEIGRGLYILGVVMRRIGLRYIILYCLAFVVAACSNTKDFSQISALEKRWDSVKILLMPLDVELSSLQAAGHTEPNAEWTTEAKALMLSAIRNLGSNRDSAILEYNITQSDVSPTAPSVQIQKLHRSVGQSILMHKVYEATYELPTKKGVFDWSLGPSVQALGQEYNADYALFLFVRDSYSSAGRVAFNIVTLGWANQGGQQIGFASLVDLHTGNVVWFNFLHDSYGDVRSEKGAVATVENLLGEMPK